jgi:microcystin-dependent protein
MDRRLFLLALGGVGSALAAPLPSTARGDRPLFEAESPDQAREALQRVGSPAFAQRVLFLVPDLAARLPSHVDRVQWVSERLKAETQGKAGVQVRVVNCDAEQKRLLASAVSSVLTTAVTPSERTMLGKFQTNTSAYAVNNQVIRRKMVAQAANAPAVPVGAEEQEQINKRNNSVQVELNAKPLRKVR